MIKYDGYRLTDISQKIIKIKIILVTIYFIKIKVEKQNNRRGQDTYKTTKKKGKNKDNTLELNKKIHEREGVRSLNRKLKCLVYLKFESKKIILQISYA